MGLSPSRLPWIVLACALVGRRRRPCSLQAGSIVVDYPLNIAGKPLFALPAYVPVTFELTVLFSAFGTFFGIWGL